MPPTELASPACSAETEQTPPLQGKPDVGENLDLVSAPMFYILPAKIQKSSAVASNGQSNSDGSKNRAKLMRIKIEGEL